MKSALIGHTGFVGSNILDKHSFTHLYHSSNIGEIDGQEFDLVVSTGFTGLKWMANKEPEKDLEGIESLLAHLEKVKAKTFVLISTVDVYGAPRNVDEDTPPDYDIEPYGRHRLMAEDRVKGLFADLRIVRLPALFGKGLKKNALFDLLNDNQLDQIRRDDVFQYYDLSRLWSDISVCLENDVPLVNLATEPVSIAELIAAFFPAKDAKIPTGTQRKQYYDVHTKHASVFGGTGPYIYDKAESLRRLKLYIDSYQPTPK